MKTLRRRSVVDVADVTAAVGAVLDPEIHRPLAELGMLGRVEQVGRGMIRVEVRLTVESCPLREELVARVTAASDSIPGVERVDVVFGVLSDAERMRLASRLRPGSGVPGGVTPVYAVASGKGGVGKSSVAANLAAALAAEGKAVGLLDADVWGYSIPQLFAVRRAPVALSGVMLPIVAHRVRLMSVGFIVPDDQPIVWRGPMLHKALEQFLGDVAWGELDALFIDLPPGTGDTTMSLLELCPAAQLIVVTTPQPAASTVAARVGRMARAARVPITGVVENMSTLVCRGCDVETPLFGAGGGGLLAEQLDAPLLGRVPLDIALRESGDRGVPAVIGVPESASARELIRIAAALRPVRRSLVGIPLPLTVTSRPSR